MPTKPITPEEGETVDYEAEESELWMDRMSSMFHTLNRAELVIAAWRAAFDCGIESAARVVENQEIKFRTILLHEIRAKKRHTK